MRSFVAILAIPLATACASLPAEPTPDVGPQYAGEAYSTCNFGEGQYKAHTLHSCGANDCSKKLRLGPGMMMTTLSPAPAGGWRKVVIEGYAQDDGDKGLIGWVRSDHICKTQP